MNKAEVVAELDTLKKSGVPIRPFRKSEKKSDLEALLTEAHSIALLPSQATTSDGSDATSASEGDLAAEAKDTADSERVDPSTIPIHSDACSPELDPDGWGGQNLDSQACIDCLKEFPECHAKCAEVTALVAEGTKAARGKRAAAGGPKNALGHRQGSQAAQIDDLLVEGKHTALELSDIVDTTVSRIRSHIYHLTSVKGCEVKNVDGKYVMPAFAITEDTAEAATGEKAA